MCPPGEVADGDGVIPGQCLRLVPALACAAGSCPGGCGVRGKVDIAQPEPTGFPGPQSQAVAQAKMVR